MKRLRSPAPGDAEVSTTSVSASTTVNVSGSCLLCDSLAKRLLSRIGEGEITHLQESDHGTMDISMSLERHLDFKVSPFFASLPNDRVIKAVLKIYRT